MTLKRKERSSHLYHYTTAEGLKGIVKEQKIWASSIFSLNDWTEFHHGRGIIEEVTEGLLQKNNTILGGHPYETILKTVRELGPATSPHIYVCCFSDKDDDLSQWRAYGPEGGFSIGFSRIRLSALAAEQHYDLIPCSYEDAPKRLLATQLINTINGLDLWNLQDFCSAIEAKFLSVVPALKNVKFAQEDETRLVSTDPPPKDGTAFRIRKGLIIPYRKFDLKDNELWRSVQVVVGPCPHAVESLEYVKMLFSSELQKSDLPTPDSSQFKNSQVPYRYW